MEDIDDVRCAIWDEPPMPWNDWGVGAAWRATTWSDARAWKTFMRSLHPLFMLLGVSILTLMADSLHIMEIGVVHRILGNVFYHLVVTRGLLRGATIGDRVQHLWALIEEAYSSVHVLRPE